MTIHGPKIYFTIPILGGIPITATTLSSFLVMVALLTAGYILGRNLTKRPSKRQVLVEKGVTMLYDLVESTMGKHNSYWAPYIGALFLSSLFGSLIGMTGFFRSATADVSTTITWAIMTSVLVWSSNIKRSGFWGWLKGFSEPSVIMTPINLISEIAQPLSMAFRHYGNIAGGSVLMSLLYAALGGLSAMIIGAISQSGVIISVITLAIGVVLFLANKKRGGKIPLTLLAIILIAVGIFGALEALGIVSGVPIFQIGIPAILSLYFDLFSSFVQALVFSLLTMVYVGIACPPEEQPQEA